MFTHSIDNAARRGFSPFSVSSWVRLAVRFAKRFLAALEVARQRRHLAQLDDRALQDIGIDRSDAQAEAERSFWDLPQPWDPRLR